MPITKTDEFNESLEAQQNLVAGYDSAAQLTAFEDLMAQQAPWATVLRGVVLMSLTSGGIKPKPLEAFKRDFLQVGLSLAYCICQCTADLLRRTDITICPSSFLCKSSTCLCARHHQHPSRSLLFESPSASSSMTLTIRLPTTSRMSTRDTHLCLSVSCSVLPRRTPFCR